MQKEPIENKDYEEGFKQEYDCISGEGNINITNKGSDSKDVFPHGTGPWDGFQLSLKMRLKYLDGEIRKYELRYIERTIEYVGDLGSNLTPSPSPGRELDIPVVVIPYLMDFFDAPVVPGRNYLNFPNR
jgi:hypothetical protein